MRNPIGFIKFKAKQFSYSTQFNVAEQSRRTKHCCLIGWDTPPTSWLKINLDGARKDSSGLASAKGLIRDDMGRLVAGVAVNLGRCSALMAEIWGAWYALNLAWEKNIKKVILEMDNFSTIQIFSKDKSSITVYHGMIMDIKRMFSLDWEVMIQHVYREGNKAADTLANLGITLPLGYHLLQVVPKEVYEILKQDLIGVSYYRT